MGRMAEDAEAVNHDARRDDLSRCARAWPGTEHDRTLSDKRGWSAQIISTFANHPPRHITCTA